MSRPVIGQAEFAQSLEEHAKWFERFTYPPVSPISGTRMHFSGALIKGVNISDALLHSALFFGCEFTNCDLMDIFFTGSVFKNVTMKSCEFSHSELNDANCDHVNFTGSRFIKAECIGTSMVGANLTDCDMKWAYLIETDIRHANLSNVNFEGTIFSDVKMFNHHKYIVKNLDTANITSLDASPDGEGGLMGGIELFKDFLA